MSAGQGTTPSGDRLRLALHYLVLVLLAVVILTPLWVMVSTSLKDQVVIFDREPLWFFFVPTLDNYEYVLNSANFNLYLANSAIVGVVSTLLTLAFGGMAAYALARMDFAGRAGLAQATLLLRMVPPAVLAVPAFSIALAFSLDSKLSGLILFYTALNLPFAIWLLFGFVKQIPIEVEEAAIVDGCSPWQVFTKVLFPLMKSGYAVAGIFTFRIAWNEFILALLLTNRSTRTLPVATTLFITDTGIEWGRIMAIGTLIVIPPLLFSFFAARQIIAGLTAGSVKG